MKFSIKRFFSKCDQIRRKHLLKKSLIENFIFCNKYVWMGESYFIPFQKIVWKNKSAWKKQFKLYYCHCYQNYPLAKGKYKIFHADS